MLKSRGLRKLALVGVLVSVVAFLGNAKPAQAWCDVLPCPELWTWTGCQCWCVCMTEECCQYYGYCNPEGTC